MVKLQAYRKGFYVLKHADTEACQIACMEYGCMVYFVYIQGCASRKQAF